MNINKMFKITSLVVIILILLVIAFPAIKDNWAYQGTAEAMAVIWFVNAVFWFITPKK